MATTMITQQRHQFGSSSYDLPYSAPPHFNNPWPVANPGQSSSQFFPSNSTGYDSFPKHQAMKANTMSMPYTSLSASVPPMAIGSYLNLPYSSDLLGSSQNLMSTSRATYDPAYSSTPAQTLTSYASQPGTYAAVGSYSLAVPQQQAQEHTRRHSQSNDVSVLPPQAAFDALDGARGMVAMSQDITPRNIYGPGNDRGHADSYGFPSTHSSHSSHSSISSSSSYPYHFAGSVESSGTDYSSASEMGDSTNSRTLPRPSGLLDISHPPAPSSMMGSFNSKVSSSTQKKHKCKICEKRFTRPSSLQTHTYSHTGEKPFACEVGGCGRNFSVVSNLRRHRKVHKSDHMSSSSDHGSPAGSSEGSWLSHD